MSHKECVIDGVLYPSVTTVIGFKPSPWLTRWREKFGKRAERKMNLCAEIGRCFHSVVEDDPQLPDHPTLARRILAMHSKWLKWSDQVRFSLESAEQHVVNRTHGYSGTFDAIGLVRGRRFLIDWKTSSGIHPEHELQLSAYAKAAQECGIKVPRYGLIVLVPKDNVPIREKIYDLHKKGPFTKFLDLLYEYKDATLDNRPCSCYTDA